MKNIKIAVIGLGYVGLPLARLFSTDNITIYDPWADTDLVRKEYDIEITNVLPENGSFDAAILAVSHNEFSKLNLKSLMKENSVIYDVKGFLDRDIVDGRL